jgi:hypothetical protein
VLPLRIDNAAKSPTARAVQFGKPAVEGPALSACTIQEVGSLNAWFPTDTTLSYFPPAASLSVSVTSLLVSQALPAAYFYVTYRNCRTNEAVVPSKVTCTPQGLLSGLVTVSYLSSAGNRLVFAASSTALGAPASCASPKGGSAVVGTILCEYTGATAETRSVRVAVSWIATTAQMLPLVADVVLEFNGNLTSVNNTGPFGIRSGWGAYKNYSVPFALLTKAEQQAEINLLQALPRASSFSLSLGNTPNVTVLSDKANNVWGRGSTVYPPGSRVFIGKVEAPILWSSSDRSMIRVQGPSYASVCGDPPKANCPADVRVVTPDSTNAWRAIATLMEIVTRLIGRGIGDDTGLPDAGLCGAAIADKMLTLPQSQQVPSADADLVRSAIELGTSSGCGPSCPGGGTIGMFQVSALVADGTASDPVASLDTAFAVFPERALFAQQPLTGLLQRPSINDAIKFVAKCSAAGDFTDVDTNGADCLTPGSPGFAKCAFGDAFQNNCQLCPFSTASPPGAICPGGSIARPRAGYWSPSETSANVVKCNYPAFERCLGWNQTTRVVDCGAKYVTGSRLCGQCAKEFYTLRDGSCGKCPDAVDPVDDFGRPLGFMACFLAGLLIVMLCLVAIVVRTYGGKYRTGFKLIGKFLVSSIIVIGVLVQVGKRATKDLPQNIIRRVFEGLVVFQFEIPIPPTKCLEDRGDFTTISFQTETIKLCVALLATCILFFLHQPLSGSMSRMFRCRRITDTDEFPANVEVEDVEDKEASVPYADVEVGPADSTGSSAATASHGAPADQLVHHGSSSAAMRRRGSSHPSLDHHGSHSGSGQNSFGTMPAKSHRVLQMDLREQLEMEMVLGSVEEDGTSPTSGDPQSPAGFREPGSSQRQVDGDEFRAMRRIIARARSSSENMAVLARNGSSFVQNVQPAEKTSKGCCNWAKDMHSHLFEGASFRGLFTKLAFTFLALIYPMVTDASLTILHCIKETVPVATYLTMTQSGRYLSAGGLSKADAAAVTECNVKKLLSPLCMELDELTNINTVSVYVLGIDNNVVCWDDRAHIRTGVLALATTLFYVILFPLFSWLVVFRRIRVLMTTEDTYAQEYKRILDYQTRWVQSASSRIVRAWRRLNVLLRGLPEPVAVKYEAERLNFLRNEAEIQALNDAKAEAERRKSLNRKKPVSVSRWYGRTVAKLKINRHRLQVARLVDASRAVRTDEICWGYTNSIYRPSCYYFRQMDCWLSLVLSMVLALGVQRTTQSAIASFASTVGAISIFIMLLLAYKPHTIFDSFQLSVKTLSLVIGGLMAGLNYAAFRAAQRKQAKIAELMNAESGTSGAFAALASPSPTPLPASNSTMSGLVASDEPADPLTLKLLYALAGLCALLGIALIVEFLHMIKKNAMLEAKAARAAEIASKAAAAKALEIERNAAINAANASMHSSFYTPGPAPTDTGNIHLQFASQPYPQMQAPMYMQHQPNIQFPQQMYMPAPAPGMQYQSQAYMHAQPASPEQLMMNMQYQSGMILQPQLYTLSQSPMQDQAPIPAQYLSQPADTTTIHPSDALASNLEFSAGPGLDGDIRTADTGPGMDGEIQTDTGSTAGNQNPERSAGVSAGGGVDSAEDPRV